MTGTSCSYAVYNAFSDVNSGDGRVPAPKSEGGKCGAVLAAEKVIREMNNGDQEKAARFDKAFLELFGSLECVDLRRMGRRCNDYVGTAARLTDEILGYSSNNLRKNDCYRI